MKENLSTDAVKELINKAGTILHKSPDKCIKFAKEALEISKKLKFDSGIGMSLMNIGLGNYYKGKYFLAIENYTKALEIFQKKNFLPAIGQVLNNFGSVYCKLNEYEKGLDYYLKAMDIDSKIGNKVNISLTLNNIGNIYNQTGNREKALKNYMQSLKIAEEIKYKNAMCNSLTNISKVHIDKEDYNTAIQYLERSRNLCIETNNYGVLIKVFAHLSDIFRKQKKYEESMRNLEKGIHYAKKMQNKKEEIDFRISIVSLKIDIDDTEKVEDELFQLENEIQSENATFLLEKIYHVFVQIYEKKGNFENALQYYKKFHKIQLKVYLDKHSEKLAELKTKFEVETKKREFEIIKQKNAELEEKVEAGIANWKEQHQLLIQKSKLESLGKLAAGIVHEINQPLQGISLGLENIKYKAKINKLSYEYISKKIQNFSENIIRIKTIIEHIRIFSREQTSLDIDAFDINNTINKALSVMRLQFKKHDITLNFNRIDQKLLTIGNKYRLEQVVINLLSNARDAVESNQDMSNKKITISTSILENFALVKVIDNGIGISEENIENIFNPFFTTKEPEKGTGLGLSIAYGIIKEMNGEIELKSELGEGTEFVISLPLLEDK